MMNAKQLQQLKQNVMLRHPTKNKRTSNKKSFPPQSNLSLQQPGYALVDIDEASLFSSTPNHGANHGANHGQLQKVGTPIVQVATEATSQPPTSTTVHARPHCPK
jgi:hypothetical protein